MRKIFLPCFFMLCISFAYAQIPSPEHNAAVEASWMEKAKNKLIEEDRFYPAEETPATYDNSNSTLKLVKAAPHDSKPQQNNLTNPASVPQNGVAAQTRPPASTASGAVVNGSAAPKTLAMAAPPKEQAPPQRPPKPRDNIKWSKKSSANFNLMSQPRTTGVPTPNLSMKFETIHQILRKNISWLMAGKSDVFVYQNREDYLRYEPEAMSWSGAFFSAGDNCIVMYDDPKNTDTLIRQFSHELTHLFFEDFFNPPGEPFRLEPPIWVNEGLAVNMEDISTGPSGDVWAGDLIYYNIYRPSAVKSAAPAGGLGIQRGGKLVSSARAENKSYPGGPRLSAKSAVFKPFGEFMKSNSYDLAVQGDYVDDWYFQAYAMVRFLFKPYNAVYPEKRIQFEQFVKNLNTYAEKKDSNGAAVKGADGKRILLRTSSEDALRKAYGFRDAADFEERFYKWLYDLQKKERDNFLKNRKGLAAQL